MKEGSLLPQTPGRRGAAWLALLVVVAAVAAAAFVWSGLYSVAASAGHWPLTSWLLRVTMENSVETHAIKVEAPPLVDPALLDRGAGHYQTGCAPCHGAPGEPRNQIPVTMLPAPPYLSGVIPEWSPEELFWIVKHGLKYTGMPAWPAQSRDDEVWAVTAFLLRLPRLTAAEYDALAKGAGEQVRLPQAGAPPVPEAPGELFQMADAALAGTCVRCHGLDGDGRPSGAFPRLGIQSSGYLYRALSEYASGMRPSGIMQPIAAALPEEEMARLARHYAAVGSVSPEPVREERDADLIRLGRRLAESGIPGRGIAACSTCHGLEEGPANPDYPVINGQYAGFTDLQLQLFVEGRRGGSPHAEIMESAVRSMTPRERRAAALFYASLPVPSRPADTAAATPLP